MIKLIVIDLDGTLLNSSGMITKRSVCAIRKAIQNNIEVVIATGRSIKGVLLTNILDTGIRYVITNNGCELWDIGTNTCLYQTGFNCFEIKDIISKLQKYPLYFDVTAGQNIYACDKNYGYLNGPYLYSEYFDSVIRVKNLSFFIEKNKILIQKIAIKIPPNNKILNDETHILFEENKIYYNDVEVKR